jgi:hypothetical protein
MYLPSVSSPSHVVMSRSPVHSGATLLGHSPISSSLPHPFLTIFLSLFPPQQMKSYNATGLPPPLLSTPPAASSPILLASFPPVTSGLILPLPSSPLSPTSAFFPSLCAAPSHLSPLHVVIGITSPRLLFPRTI